MDAINDTRGFNFSSHMAALCHDISERVDDLRHVRMERVAVSVAQTRSAAQYGMWASLTPLRFKEGATQTVRRGRRYKMPRIFKPDGTEALYILTFYLPRFLTLSFADRIATVCHELFHISPKFDGDIRRFPGRCYAHAGNHGEFDAQSAALAETYLKQSPSETLYAFCRLDFDEIQNTHGRIYGMRYRQPRLVPE